MRPNAMQRLFSLTEKKERKIIGLMSGTSLDGVDLALITVKQDGTPPTLNEFVTLPYPTLVTQQIRRQMEPEGSSVREICQLNVSLGQLYGDLILRALEMWGMESSDIDCIGSHGQTLYHAPDGTNWLGIPFSSTFQIGDGDQIATKTNTLTISDFRMKDIAMGGEGAPLLPYIDHLLFSNKESELALHNLGGISNLTYLPTSENTHQILAFDTGPANVLINLACEHFWDVSFDEDGNKAAQGTSHEGLLSEMLGHPFFEKVPPKSTGREMFGLPYFQEILQKAQSMSLSDLDLVSTLTTFTARTIQRAYQRFLPHPPLDVYFSGGGVHNKTLMQEIQTLLPEHNILNFSELGIDPDAREAIGFALFANNLINGTPVTFPGITGAQSETVLGKISFPLD